MPTTGPGSRNPTAATESIRRAAPSDAAGMLAIYNDAVATTTATFDTEPRTLAAQRAWLRQHASPFVALVAEREEAIVGWASISRWSERRAYDATGEVSVYVAADFRGQGIGSRLLSRLVEEGASAGLHTLLARIADGNPVSRRVHERAGFERVGVMREVGFKFGRRIDVYLYQRMFADASPRDAGRPAG